MCILFLFVNERNILNNQEFKLILASNRDEFYARPAKDAGQWLEDPNVYGGRDLEPGREGGTWLAVGYKEKVLRIGALLNVTGEENKEKVCAGRGPIVEDYVKSVTSNAEYSENLLKNDYNAFNFVTAEIDFSHKTTSILHASNTPQGVVKCDLSTALGFGNSPLSTPLQKVKAGTEMFDKIVKNHSNSRRLLVDQLMDLLKCKERFYPDEELQKRAPQWAGELCQICVKMPEAGYGSRTHTVILIDHNNKMDYYEETMATANPDGQWNKTHIEKQL